MDNTEHLDDQTLAEKVINDTKQLNESIMAAKRAGLNISVKVMDYAGAYHSQPLTVNITRTIPLGGVTIQRGQNAKIGHEASASTPQDSEGFWRPFAPLIIRDKLQSPN